ncbi:MAG: hypothetical protein KDD53_07905, partial [Bdellovibrionales bacterium]|nr:hypothetical protein [Bdellovibrionales bacterium]
MRKQSRAIKAENNTTMEVNTNMNKILQIPVLHFSLGLLVTVLIGASLNANAQTEGKYLGVATCASSNCHGSTAPRKGSNILHNEYVTWKKHDAHSRAWSVLNSDESKKIAKNLGIAAAHKEKLCLECHTTYVPVESHRSEKFSENDGVGCESCHGAAEKWLKPHAASDATHANNISLGMTDLVPINKRAALCLSCHYGTDEKFVSHRLMGAGHPRLSFELDTFSMIQPAHWELDKDYRDRKGEYTSARGWMVGQAALSIEMTKALLSDKRSKDGIWPELTLFNCYACHHDLTTDQWKVRDYDKRPGQLRLNISSLRIVSEVAKILAPQESKRLKAAIL